MSYTPEQIQERYDKLPADIRQAIDSVDTTNTIVDIGEKHSLMYDQISELVDEVGLVMVGLTPSDRFAGNISRRMKVDIGKAMLVTKDINKEVFDRMRQSLKKIEGDENAGTKGSGAEQRKPASGQDEETMTTDAEKAKQKSVIEAVEKAGGFVIERPEPAPLQAEKMVRTALTEKLEPKKDILNILEKDTNLPPSKPGPAKVEGAPVASDHLLGDVPESASTNSKEVASSWTPSKNEAPKAMDQSSIVDMLLSKGVAMPMDSNQDGGRPSAAAQKLEDKKKPYDGTDPYREPVE